MKDADTSFHSVPELFPGGILLPFDAVYHGSGFPVSFADVQLHAQGGDSGIGISQEIPGI